MTVTCKASKCPYWSGGFCTKLVVGIDEMGMCSMLWRRGQPKQLYNTGFIPRQNIIIEEEQERRQENLTSSVPATDEQSVEKTNDEETSQSEKDNQELGSKAS